MELKISVELTLAPLQDDFEPAIKDFIKKLRTSKFVVLENPLSTQIYGDYDEVMSFLKDEIKEAFLLIENGLLLMKIVKTDRHNYEPSF